MAPRTCPRVLFYSRAYVSKIRVFFITRKGSGMGPFFEIAHVGPIYKKNPKRREEKNEQKRRRSIARRKLINK